MFSELLLNVSNGVSQCFTCGPGQVRILNKNNQTVSNMSKPDPEERPYWLCW